MDLGIIKPFKKNFKSFKHYKETEYIENGKNGVAGFSSTGFFSKNLFHLARKNIFFYVFFKNEGDF